MGWTNFVVIPEIKVAIEVSRSVTEIEDYIKEDLDRILECNIDYYEVSGASVRSMTLDELNQLMSLAKPASSLQDMDDDKFLLYWLSKRKIEYEIVSEMDFEKSNYRGFRIIRIKYD